MRQDPARKKIQHYSYELTDELGRGYSSVVYRARDDRTSTIAIHADETVAIKVVDMRMLQDQLHKELLRNEIASLNELKGSRHVLRLIEVIATANNTYIVTELCDGKDLSHQIQMQKGLSDEQTLNVMRQLVVGYLDICQKGIVHRDLKPANIFFREGVLKIADFGFAVKIDKCTRPMSYNIGSPSYMAPEALRDNRYSFKSDIWSLGVIIFETLHARVPWKSEDDRTLLRLLMNDPIEKHVGREHHATALLMSFMKKCCNPYPGLRIEPEQLTEFIQQYTVPPLHQPSTLQQLPSQAQIPAVHPNSVLISPQQAPTVVAARHPPAPFDMHFPMVPMTSTNKSIMVQPSSLNVSTVPPPQAPTPSQVMSPLGGGGTGTGTIGLFNLLKTSNTRATNPAPNLFTTDIKAKFIDHTVIVTKPMSSLQIASPNITAVVVEPQAPEDDAPPQHAQDCLVAQLQYCRFMNCILEKLQELPMGAIRIEASTYFRSELLQKLGLLHRIVTSHQNIFELDGFTTLVRLPIFHQLRELVLFYNDKFNETYKGEPPKFNSSEAVLVASIKSLDPSSHTHLLQLMLSYYQIKLLQKRIDYNDFADRTKIHMLVSDASTCRASSDRLRQRMKLLGISK